MSQHSLGAIVLASIRPVIVRYCRARIGRRDNSFAVADLVAKETMHAVLRALPQEQDPLLAVTYRVAAGKVDEELAGEPGCAGAELNIAGLPADQREIIVLRVICGLTAEQTAEAIGAAPSAVRIAQHRALMQLRKAAPMGRNMTRFGHGMTLETLSDRC